MECGAICASKPVRTLATTSAAYLQVQATTRARASKIWRGSPTTGALQQEASALKVARARMGAGKTERDQGGEIGPSCPSSSAAHACDGAQKVDVRLLWA